MNCDELFRFEEIEGGFALAEYRQKDNKKITKFEIPAEYKGLPVVAIAPNAFECAEYLTEVKIPETVVQIGRSAFNEATRIKRINIPKKLKEIADYAFRNLFELKRLEIPEGIVKIGKFALKNSSLKTVVLPKSLEVLDNGAFEDCIYLENVVFNSAPRLGRQVFRRCSFLPADVTVMGLVDSCDITRPLETENFNWMFKYPEINEFKRRDVFELAVKNNCFRNVDLTIVFNYIINSGYWDYFEIAARYGMLESAGAEVLNKVVEYSAQHGKTELTAYLLELKKRKFGFDGDDKFEL